MVSAGLGENCYDRTVMSHTEHGGQASDQDSNSGPGRHRQPRRTDRLQRTGHDSRASDYLGHAESPTPTLADLTRPAR